MKIVFAKRFDKAFDKIRDKRLSGAIVRIVDETRKAQNPAEIPNLKKMSGHKTAFRVRIKDYRIGVFIEKGTVEFTVFAHRKDIYDMFP